MTNYLEDCISFCDFGMKKEIFIPITIYENFIKEINTIMVLAAMSDFTISWVQTTDKSHSFRLLKDGKRAYTIVIQNNVDKFFSNFDINVFYHFHHNDQIMIEVKEKFLKIYGEKFFIDDNSVYLSTEDEIIEGLKLFPTIL